MKVPKGWRLLKRHEKVRAGDKRRGPVTGKYVHCQASVGFAAGLKTIIRKMDPTDEVKKGSEG